jgi:DNA-binding MarR family transcriptional regulator
VQQLEKAGLVARRAAPGDDRSTIVELTPSGREVLQRVLPGHVALVRDLVLDPLSAPDRRNLTRLLDKVRRHMRARPPRSATPPPGSTPAGRPHG